MTEKFTPLYWKTKKFGYVDVEWERLKAEIDRIAPERTVLNIAAVLDQTDRDDEGEPWGGVMWLARKVAMLAAVDPNLLTIGDGLNLIQKLGKIGMVGWSQDLSDDINRGGYVLKPDDDEKWKKELSEKRQLELFRKILRY